LLQFYSSSGQWLPLRADQLVEQTPTPYRLHKLVKRYGKASFRITQIGWVNVRLPGRDEDLTLVVCRLVLLSVLVMIYLGWLVEEHPNICDRLVYLSQPLPDNPDFLAYRLLTGLTEAINTCFWLHKDLLRKSLW